MLRLSFIVPFYNVEPYIEECIRSLYNQDIPHEEYEVMCVDDCSPDGSRAIVERLQKEFPTLKLLIHTENKRQGGARNTGMKVAQGKYIWFVDSDDYIKPNCLRKLLDIAEKEDLDILQMYFTCATEQKIKMVDYGICTGSQYVFDAPISEYPAQRCCVVWRSIIKRDLLIRNNIWFEEKVQYEDDDYAYMFFAHAQRLHLVPQAPYVLRIREGSTTHSVCTIQSLNYICKQIERVINLSSILVAFDKRWHTLIKQGTVWSCKRQILDELKNMSDEDVKEFYRKKIGRGAKLYKYLSLRIWLSMRYYWFYKYIYLRNV